MLRPYRWLRQKKTLLEIMLIFFLDSPDQGEDDLNDEHSPQ